jgi:SHS2 domain-containing protein
VPWEYLEDGVTSDVTFRAFAPDLDALFQAAADATTGLMVENPATIAPLRAIPIAVHSAALDLLLMRFLDEMIFHKDAERLILRAEAVRVTEANGGWGARAVLRGEPLDPGRHALAADVKAVTLHGLRVERKANGWEAEVTLDV